MTAWVAWLAGTQYHSIYEPLVFEAGSPMEFYAAYNASIETAYFYLENAWTGEVILAEMHLGTNYYDGASAESITERPGTGEGTHYPLLNFGEITWWSVTVQNLNNVVSNIGEVNNLQIEMTSTGKKEVPIAQLLALPGALSLNQNYPEYYYHCQ